MLHYGFGVQQLCSVQPSLGMSQVQVNIKQQDELHVKHVTCATSLLTPSARSCAALLMHAPLTLLRALHWLAAQPCGRNALTDGACCTVLCLGAGNPDVPHSIVLGALRVLCSSLVMGVAPAAHLSATAPTMKLTPVSNRPAHNGPLGL